MWSIDKDVPLTTVSFVSFVLFLFFLQKKKHIRLGRWGPGEREGEADAI